MGLFKCPIATVCVVKVILVCLIQKYMDVTYKCQSLTILYLTKITCVGWAVLSCRPV